jgi:uncharacterized membrane protein HdeD (DUF308 family)
MVAVAFGVAAFLAPRETMAFLVLLFGAFAFADGVFTVGAGLSVSWLSLFLEGVVGMVVGLLTWLVPSVREFWFVELIAAWAFITGALELVGAYRLRKVATGPLVRAEWLLAASGIVSLVLGVLLTVQTYATGLEFVAVLGGYAVISGLLLLALGWNIRTWPHIVPPAATA